jgi:hypothetical protein
MKKCGETIIAKHLVMKYLVVGDCIHTYTKWRAQQSNHIKKYNLLISAYTVSEFDGRSSRIAAAHVNGANHCIEAENQ